MPNWHQHQHPQQQQQQQHVDPAHSHVLRGDMENQRHPSHHPNAATASASSAHPNVSGVDWSHATRRAPLPAITTIWKPGQAASGPSSSSVMASAPVPTTSSSASTYSGSRAIAQLEQVRYDSNSGSKLDPDARSSFQLDQLKHGLPRGHHGPRSTSTESHPHGPMRVQVHHPHMTSSASSAFARVKSPNESEEDLTPNDRGGMRVMPMKAPGVPSHHPYSHHHHQQQQQQQQQQQRMIPTSAAASSSSSSSYYRGSGLPRVYQSHHPSAHPNQPTAAAFHAYPHRQRSAMQSRHQQQQEEFVDNQQRSPVPPQQAKKQKISSSSSSTAAASASSIPTTAATERMRTTRYLTEADREMILQRIKSGEKQAQLAREYQVSRAAISNLKQRRRKKEMEEASGTIGASSSSALASGSSSAHTGGGLRDPSTASNDSEELPLSVSTKGSSASNSAASSPSTTPLADARVSYPSPNSDVLMASVGDQPEDEESMDSAYSSASSGWPKRSLTVCDVASASSSMKMLLSRVLDRQSEFTTFRRSVERIARHCLEEAFALVPLKRRILQTPSGEKFSGKMPQKDFCAFTIHANAFCLLQEFRFMEPSSLTKVAAECTSEAIESLVAHLPQHRSTYNVFLLGLTCAMAYEDSINMAVQTLLDVGVSEENVFLVFLFSDREVLRVLQARFPRVHFVSATVVSCSTPEREFLSSPFLDRFDQLSDPNNHNNNNNNNNNDTIETSL